MLTLAAVAGWALPSMGQTAAGAVRSPVRLPYTAEFKTTRVQTLQDGSTVTHETTEVMARDSQGRTLNSWTNSIQGDVPAEFTNVAVHDPVAKTHTSWFVPGQRVTVSSFAEAEQGLPSCAAGNQAQIQAQVAQRSNDQRERPKPEDLGKQTFQGLEARGNRTVQTYAAGEIGNSAPLTHVTEVWFSTTPGLEGINVHQVNDDPRNGKETRDLVKFVPGEPDAALFQPPAENEVVTQETHNEVRCP
jgi:hypothetical protein